MEFLICGALSGVVAFVTYTQSTKAKKADEKNKARLWMLVSIVAGLFTVLSILSLFA